MNYTLILLITTIGLISNSSDTSGAFCENSEYILKQSKNAHDPDNEWGDAILNIRIQEPRLQNPQRYSVLTLNNKTGYFSLIRDSEVGKVERIIDEEGAPVVLVNGSTQIDEATVNEYRLGEDRNAGYRSFYELMYGLPMSVSEDKLAGIEEGGLLSLEGQEVYGVRIELKEAMISKHWVLYFDKSDYSLAALKFDHSEDSSRPDEILMFDGEYKVGEITIPRFRHWYHQESGEYRGSDVILKDLSDN
ncbi:DUF6503 family protein [Gracilimonas sediminicola]|uniref:DUF6503 family protein n=1 Tax=Gracilimonas sediminicola TaxID=2952158 RepID=A0A9X2L1H0_9BACT|nr:DUF6503 family protein [Gracilimonas sediminicola]MCP9290586.1 DUF6503 family protein [Gracilimonas sediminicola]